MKAYAMTAIIFYATLLSAHNGLCKDKEEDIQGVNGSMYLIEKNKENAGQKDSITVNVGDKIEITWSYPVVPGSVPTTVGARSNSTSVKAIEILSIIKPKIVGAGTLGAFFEAKAAGKATIDFDINNGSTSDILEVDVVVNAKQ